MRRLPVLLIAVTALALPSAASADAGSAIVRQCLNTGAVGTHYSQQAYSEALRELPADVTEYSDCQQLIRQAQLAAGAGHGGSGLAPAPSVPAASFTPVERASLQGARNNGSQPVRVGSSLVRPGIVKANLASSVSTLPRPLLVVLALLLICAAAIALWRLRDTLRGRGPD